MSAAAPRLKAILRATVLALAALIPAVVGGYGFVHRDRLFPEHHTVVVYGRESCSITRSVREGLHERNIPYLFADIDIPAIDDELRYKLGPRFKEPTYTLPVVHVAGQVLLTPSAERIAQALARVPPASPRDYSTFLNGADPVPHY